MVGGFVVELDTSRRARIVAGVRNADIEEAGQLGAEMAFDTAGGLENAIRAEWPEGIDGCIDTVDLGADGLACVRDGGAFVTSVPTAVPDAGWAAREDRPHPVGRRQARSRIQTRGTSTALS
jgi:hypothetical protein